MEEIELQPLDIQIEQLKTIPQLHQQLFPSLTNIITKTSKNQDIILRLINTDNDNNANLKSFYYLLFVWILCADLDENTSTTCQPKIQETELLLSQNRLKKLKLLVLSEDFHLNIIYDIPTVYQTKSIAKLQIHQNSQVDDFTQITLTSTNIKNLFLQFINLIKTNNQQRLQQGQLYEFCNKYPVIDVVMIVILRSILWEKYEIYQAKNYNEKINDHTVYTSLCDVFSIQNLECRFDNYVRICHKYQIYWIWSPQFKIQQNKFSSAILTMDQLKQCRKSFKSEDISNQRTRNKLYLIRILSQCEQSEEEQDQDSGDGSVTFRFGKNSHRLDVSQTQIHQQQSDNYKTAKFKLFESYYKQQNAQKDSKISEKQKRESNIHNIKRIESFNKNQQFQDLICFNSCQIKNLQWDIQAKLIDSKSMIMTNRQNQINKNFYTQRQSKHSHTQSNEQILNSKYHEQNDYTSIEILKFLNPKNRKNIESAFQRMGFYKNMK